MFANKSHHRGNSFLAVFRRCMCKGRIWTHIRSILKSTFGHASTCIKGDGGDHFSLSFNKIGQGGNRF